MIMNFSSINQVAVTSDENGSWNCCIWDPKTGASVMRYKGGNSVPRSLSFIGDDYVISGLKEKNVLNIWTLKMAHVPKYRVHCIGQVRALAVSPTGSHCVGAIGCTLYLWKILNGELFCILNDHIRDVSCIKFTDDGQYFVSAGSCDFVLVWKLMQLINCARSASSENSRLKPMHIWNLDNMTLADVHVGNFGAQCRVAVAMCDGICKVYEMSSGKCLYTVFIDKILHSVIMDPAELYLFLGTESGSIIMHDIYSWCNEESISIPEDQIKALSHSHRDAVTCLSLSLNGHLLLSGSRDKTAIIQDVFKGFILHTFKHDGPVTNAFFASCPEALQTAEIVEPKQLLQPFKFTFLSDNSETMLMRPKPHHVDMNTASDLDGIVNYVLKEREEKSCLKEKEKIIEKVEEVRKANAEIYMQTMAKVWQSLADSL